MPYNNCNLFNTDNFTTELNIASLITKKNKKKRFIPNIIQRSRKSQKIPINNRSKVLKKSYRKQRISMKIDLNTITDNMSDLCLDDDDNSGCCQMLEPSPMWYVGDTDNYLNDTIETINSVIIHSPTPNTDNNENFIDTEFYEVKSVALVDKFLLDTSGAELKVLGYLGESVDEFLMPEDFIDDQYPYTQADNFWDKSGPIDFTRELLDDAYLMIMPIDQSSESFGHDPSKFQYEVVDNLEEFKRLLDFDCDLTELEMKKF